MAQENWVRTQRGKTMLVKWNKGRGKKEKEDRELEKSGGKWIL
jgi:hypothetical protein